MTEQLLKDINAFVEPFGWTASVHTEMQDGVAIRLSHATTQLGAWLTAAEIADGTWHDKVRSVVDPSAATTPDRPLPRETTHGYWAPVVGQIATGRYADMVAVEGDPLSNVRLLEKPAAVIKGGKRIEPAR